MADAKTHALIAGVAGVGAYAIYCRRNAQEVKFLDAMISGLIAVIGGLAPDLIEPANNPNHRSLFHSLAAGAALIHGTNQVISSDVRDWNTAGAALIHGTNQVQSDDRVSETAKLMMVLLVVGYVSHIFADALTPKGLPVLC